ncbi:glycogen synthase [Achromatium sp. WMS3]|nr:glycogen synthase [Achromatium sp. WMS3]
MAQTNHTASLKVLFATSEALPFIKTGGLADVSGSLPAALRARGHDVRLILPAYPMALRKAGEVTTVATLNLPGIKEVIYLLESQLHNINAHVYLVSAHEHFDRGGNPYTNLAGTDWGDNPERFALLCRVISLLAKDQAGLHWQPDIVHCNDWQTGLVPLFLSDRSNISNIPAIVFTIHNLCFQGIFDRAAFKRLKLPESLWNPQGIEYHGDFSFLKGGILFSNCVNTVSPTYAKEVCLPKLGCGFDGMLAQLGDRFSGILNGIDYKEWNPATDPYIAHNYDIESFANKTANKLVLQEAFGLPKDTQAMLFGYVGRVTAQKGVDLILSVLPQLLNNQITKHKVQVVFQGFGDAVLEQELRTVAKQYPNQVGVNVEHKIDEQQAHRVEAGSDCFLMPSHFEPCGLTQLYSLRYGTVPIVHNTGGLADTIIDASLDNLAQGIATGFVFEHPDSEGLWYALKQAMQMYTYAPDTWQKLALNGMQQNFSWDRSATRYEELYLQAIAK